MDDDDVEVKKSPLCREYSAHGHAFTIEIYEGDPGQWILEVIDPLNTSHVWDDQFDSDQVALEQAIDDIDYGDIEGFGRKAAKVINLSAAIRRAVDENGTA
jgi:hypothetical protein